MVVAHGMSALIAGHRDDSAALDEHLAAIESIPIRDIARGKPVSEVFLARALAAERAGNLGQAEAILAECLDTSLAEVMSDVGSVAADAVPTGARWWSCRYRGAGLRRGAGKDGHRRHLLPRVGGIRPDRGDGCRGRL